MGTITKINIALLCLFAAFTSVAQQEIPLYSGPVPNAKDVRNEEVKTASNVVSKVSLPALTVFLPPKEKATGAAVIVCPGGGYGVLVIKREGYDVAEAFTKQGIAAFVLKYRLPNDKTMIDPSIGPLQDAQQAIKTIRQRAAEWNIDPTKIGIMGFSAGGHLAATAGTHFEKPVLPGAAGISVRPDFMILVYPVISFMEGIGHKGSGANLLGKNASSEQIKLFSNELQVTSSTPPAFITHASDDTVVPVSNSLLFYEALQRQHIPGELHIYSKGEHGYLKVPAFEEWFGRCLHWMATAGFVK
ncbi:alpha/beta hydrolase [Runella slithyformis]|uniref:Esterase/lipase-like protein n=1 Tax=Runella slithyformis (strain ATCC 29530 / DSM 19594 / LMG 11500 / NCIMB 11436 / LSU 4) TaxID=761193 RepID=A0A7U3ZLJ4_RUNSL|nr:alpha/beta hydrolase [Runella slithyformis]AEI49426.1 esterase/lipase-like protein [Runella slithyformis DSM 19594]